MKSPWNGIIIKLETHLFDLVKVWHFEHSVFIRKGQKVTDNGGLNTQQVLANPGLEQVKWDGTGGGLLEALQLHLHLPWLVGLLAETAARVEVRHLLALPQWLGSFVWVLCQPLLVSLEIKHAQDDWHARAIFFLVELLYLLAIAELVLPPASALKKIQRLN